MHVVGAGWLQVSQVIGKLLHEKLVEKVIVCGEEIKSQNITV